MRRYQHSRESFREGVEEKLFVRGLCMLMLLGDWLYYTIVSNIPIFKLWSWFREVS